MRARSHRQSLVFACGVLLGVFAGVAMLSGLHVPGTTANAAPAATPVAASPPQIPSSLPASSCGFDPLLVAAPNRLDGKFAAPMDAAGRDPQDVPAYIAVGTDAASQKRPRDAEIALISACRMAAQLVGGDSPQMADAKYHLANLYLEALPSGGPGRVAVLKRAQSLFSESVTLYGAKFGLDSEKTRLAAAGFANAQSADPAPLVAGALPEVINVPRVLLDERNTLPITVAMGAPPVKKRPGEKRIEEEEASPTMTSHEAAAATQHEDKPVEVRRIEPPGEPRDALRLDTAPKWSGNPGNPDSP